MQRVREAISAKHQLAASDIMRCSPRTRTPDPPVWLRDCGEVSPQYMEELRAKLVSVAGEALTEMRPASVAHAVKEVSGSPQMPRGGADHRPRPTRRVPRGRWKDDRRSAQLPCHAVCLRHDNLSISADYPGALARMVAVETDCPVLFANGACGDSQPHPSFHLRFPARLPVRWQTRAGHAPRGGISETFKLRIMQKRMQLPCCPAQPRRPAEVEEYESAALRESLQRAMN